ncbi:hypothetical protein K1719_005777 [Acacia pycnantha]|nr:hypothetical protein K1719_005777 [Acacia pycnantha]
MNNACTSTRQLSQSNSAPSSLDLSTSQHSHQMSSLYETPQRDLHHSQDIWTNQNRGKRAPLGEGADCKNCKCKKANCLKRYCKCFASGEYCMGSCSCQNCYNRPTHEDKVIAARKVDPSKTPASTGHIRGCNCKKSKCKKNYCECYENGVPCSINCRCTGCNNPYSCLNSTASFRTLSWADSSNASLGGSSKRKRPSNFDIPDASGFDASRRINETINILRNRLNFDEDNLESSPELQMPNIHQVGDGSSTTCVNNSSNSVGERFIIILAL